MYALSLFFLALLPSLTHADQIQSLHRGDLSLAAFYSAARSAKATIDLATLTIEPCQAAPKLLLEELVKKAASGVRVRVMVDNYLFKNPLKRDFTAYLASKGIQIRYYNQFEPNHRSHIKSFVVDGTSYIVGGRNLSDEYFGLDKELNYVDQDLLIRGASARAAQQGFEELWNAAGSASSGGSAETFAATCLKLNARDAALRNHLSASASSILASAPIRSCANVTYASDVPNFMDCLDCKEYPERPFLSGERFYKKRATRLVLDFISGARSRLQLANQYYIPWHKLGEALAELRGRGVNVEVTSNATGDAPRLNKVMTCLMQSSAFTDTSGSQRVDLLGTKGSMQSSWALSPRGSSWRIHSKSGVRDGRDVLVSSYNIDPRSYATNLESGVVVEDCPALARDVSQQLDQLQGFSARDARCGAACRSEIVKDYQRPNLSCGFGGEFL